MLIWQKSWENKRLDEGHTYSIIYVLYAGRINKMRKFLYGTDIFWAQKADLAIWCELFVNIDLLPNLNIYLPNFFAWPILFNNCSVMLVNVFLLGKIHCHTVRSAYQIMSDLALQLTNPIIKFLIRLCLNKL